MSKDPYELLGVSRDASQEDIGKAYRKLAKDLHPDLHPGDTKAADRFKEVSQAYQILKDPETRKRYDRGEIDASGQETPQQHYYREYAGGNGGRRYHSSAGFEDMGDMSDLFADLFGGRMRGAGAGGGREFHMRGADVHYHLDVDFLDAAKGAKKRITMPDGGTLDVTIPEGVRDGQTLRLKGKGQPGRGSGPAGDALVEISVRPHAFFERRGDDIHVTLPISLDEAVLGAKVQVPTISGRVSLTVPKGASGGKTLRMRGKGVKKARGAGHGDQLVTLRIDMPSRVDDELAEFMKEWREKHGYDPRASMKAG